MGTCLLAATLLTLVLWLRAERNSTLHLIGPDEPGTLVFALTNHTQSLVDYRCQVETWEAGQWTVRRMRPGAIWQRPPYRDELGIPPGHGVRFCANHLPPEGQWRLRVTIASKPGRWAQKRLIWALRLRPRYPQVSEWLKPAVRTQVLFSDPLPGQNVPLDVPGNGTRLREAPRQRRAFETLN